MSVKIDVTTRLATFEYVVHTDVRNASKIFLENSIFAVCMLDKNESNDSNYRSTIETKINLFLF